MKPGRLSRVIVILACLSWLALSVGVGQSSLPRILVWEESLRGAEDRELRWPVAVAAASAEEIAVADAFGSRLLVFRKVGVSWQVDRAVSLLGVPVGLAHDGRRYIASLRGQGLIALEGEQLLQRRIAQPRDLVPGPLSIGPDGTLLVYDFAGEKVLRLSADGSVTRELPVDGQVTALAATPGGGFYAAVGEKGTILRYDAAGRLIATWEIPGVAPVPAWPVGVAVEPGGDVAVVDRHGGRILLYDAAGRPIGVGSRKGWEPGLVRFPRGITRLPDGRYLLADEGNGRAQIFRRTDRSNQP